MNTNGTYRAPQLNFAPVLAHGASRVLASRGRPLSMLLASVLHSMGGGSRQPDEISELARQLRAYNEQFAAAFNENKFRRLPLENAAADEQQRHARTMNPLTEASAAESAKAAPFHTQSAQQGAERGALELGGARAFAVPTGRKNPDGSPEMRAMTPLEVKSAEHQQQQEFDQAGTAEKFKRQLAIKNWDDDALPPGTTDSLGAWETWAQANGVEVLKPEARDYSPKAADAVHRETAAKHIQFLSDLQRRLEQGDAVTGAVNLNFGPGGMLDGTPKLRPETKRKIMDIEARKNALYNRLAEPALFGEKDQPLFTLKPEEFRMLVDPQPPQPEPAVAAAAPAAAAPAAPMGMNNPTNLFSGRGANPYSPEPAALEPPPALRMPAGQSLGAQLFPGGAPPAPRTLDPATARQFYEAAGGDPQRARQMATEAGWIVPRLTQ
ncbi:MAG: hypothetical protein HZC54_00635 [Verrucomicrobia bacterium]|nr:hypothetical protein [Verrucomicrobiota bacterium]